MSISGSELTFNASKDSGWLRVGRIKPPRLQVATVLTAVRTVDMHPNSKGSKVTVNGFVKLL